LNEFTPFTRKFLAQLSYKFPLRMLGVSHDTMTVLSYCCDMIVSSSVVGYWPRA